ncbi:hypothetical protein Airi01_019570 [Actinoallomurus iriomotensis]|uniref:Uncharacterized protein n=1 Tax=Actinoallomurus iriomotensis TaxID=478107 RepID=A0A9W6RGW1_9ACTN|nr:hypothetical protein Airi01_019570 [Actinoallomurus iriomotensis]
MVSFATVSAPASLSSGPPLVDELQDEGGRPDLRDRSDLEQRVGGRRHAGLPVEDARGRLGDLVAAGRQAQDAECGPGDAVPFVVRAGARYPSRYPALG